jgi:hypothetical protein
MNEGICNVCGGTGTIGKTTCPICDGKKGNFPKILIYDIKNFPLPNSLKNIKEIEDLVQKTLSNYKKGKQTHEEEDELNKFIYQLYGLTDDEIRTIEDNI